MGFNNAGIERVLRNLERIRKRYRGIVGINIGKNKETPNERAQEDYLACFRAVRAAAEQISSKLGYVRGNPG